MKKLHILLTLFLVSIMLCQGAWAAERLKLATTTSTDNSGLLKVLLPPFEKAHDCQVDVIAVGTGKAIKIAEQGNVDVVLVHARKLEDKFVAEGWGVNRRDVMYNDFVILGPASDPAQIAGDPRCRRRPEEDRCRQGSASSRAATSRGRTRRRKPCGRRRG